LALILVAVLLWAGPAKHKTEVIVSASTTLRPRLP
jgi:hypothetical protein